MAPFLEEQEKYVKKFYEDAEKLKKNPNHFDYEM